MNRIPVVQRGLHPYPVEVMQTTALMRQVPSDIHNNGKPYILKSSRTLYTEL